MPKKQCPFLTLSEFLIENLQWLHKNGFFWCNVELNIHQADYWDRRDETCISYSQTPLKLETMLSSKVSSSLVKENICKC